jgi:hypothetical protein
MEKATVQLEVKMHEMLKVPKVRESKVEQRSGQRSVAEDLKMIYERAAGQAMEKRRLQQRLAQMEQEEREEEEAEEREPIVTSISFQSVLREILLPRSGLLEGAQNGPGEGDSGTKGRRAEGPHIRAARGHHSERSRNAFRAEPFRTFRYPGEPSWF